MMPTMIAITLRLLGSQRIEGPRRTIGVGGPTVPPSTNNCSRLNQADRGLLWVALAPFGNRLRGFRV